jgi:hypothetical protein
MNTGVDYLGPPRSRVVTASEQVSCSECTGGINLGDHLAPARQQSRGEGGRRGQGRGRAMTIHQVQGFSIDTAVIDFSSDVFPHGQAYVALSRLRSLEGVLLSNLKRKLILMDRPTGVHREC